MKRLTAACVIALLALPLSGSAMAGKKPIQEESGTVYAPAPYPQDDGLCYAGIHRRAAILAQGNANGLAGYNFEVDPKTWKKPFNLEVAGSRAGNADLDIYFYLADLGTPQQVAEDPQNAGSPPTISFNTREPGGEIGKVPPLAEHVIVCLYSGASGQSFGADFTYTAG